MDQVTAITYSTVAWAMLVVVSPVLGAVLGRYLAIQLGNNGNASQRGALGAVAGYIVGVGLALIGILQSVDHVLKLVPLLFPHLQ